MKKTYRIALKLRGSTTVLAEDFKPGEFVSQEVTYDIPDGTSNQNIAIALHNSSSQLIEDCVETVIEVVDDNEK